MAIRQDKNDLSTALHVANARAHSGSPLPELWLQRAAQLDECPSKSAIAAYGSLLLAKSANEKIDPHVLQARDGGESAFSLRGAATVMAENRRAMGFDIGSKSDRDPINSNTWIKAKRWNEVLGGVARSHKPWVQRLISWLPDINLLSSDEATDALAAYIKVRQVKPTRIPSATTGSSPSLVEMIEAIEAFLTSHVDVGAAGMAVVVGLFQASGDEAKMRSSTDPVRLDVKVSREGHLHLGCEVKQLETHAATAFALGEDVRSAGIDRGLLAVLPPGSLGDLSRTDVIRQIAEDKGVLLQVTNGVTELVAEVFARGPADLSHFLKVAPRLIAESIEQACPPASVDDWVAIVSRWI